MLHRHRGRSVHRDGDGLAAAETERPDSRHRFRDRSLR